LTEHDDTVATTANFGFREVNEQDKAGMVAEVFHSVASRYDLMNDLMSGGVHRLWKDYTLQVSGVRAGHRILDVAGGSGDMALRFARRVGPTGHVVLSDINSSMLAEGRRRMVDEGIVDNVSFLLTDAENLSVSEDSFDRVCIAFGLRNVTRIDRALASMYRALKPGGKLMILEFSKPVTPTLNKLYDAYSFNVLPKLGGLVTGDPDSYQYLVESIRKHPDQETLKQKMLDAGFERASYHNLTGGVVALHIGVKF